MSEVLREVSALLELFQKAEWRDLHLRTARYSLFLAKDNGSANPMLQMGPVEVGTTVLAPHVATVSSLCTPGTTVQKGDALGQLEVLGECESLLAPHAGVVGTILAPVGTLVEYQTPVLTLLET